MSTHADFLHAIAAHPEEDAPRLIYADWLEERGDADRAEFIRVQCELAQVPQEEPRRVGLEMRQNQLLLRHCQAWLAALPVQPPWRLRNGTFYEFERGFLTALCVRARDFLAHAPALFAAAPLLRHVRFKNLGEVPLSDFLRSPFLERLNALDLSYERLDDETTEEIAVCHFLGNVSTLLLTGNEIGETGATALAHSPHLRNVTLLDLAYNGYLWDGILALAQSATLANLKCLRLSPNAAGWETREQARRLLEARGCRLQGEPHEE